MAQLTRTEVAARCGLRPNTLDTYRERGAMPEPDGYLGNKPWWWDTTIDAWQAERRRQPKTTAAAREAAAQVDA